ncbi:hypothetical protein AM587_10009770 [Phytophthora nicotianae]|uniref:Uncharacterized protein n=1 Tax=Phytophthora nicotianae TaxID=4792 RepID=A0A0W8CR05_PHYNI|nr:hypothetical protein AM587_10009770 [Phytophthora nicotianae]
MTEEYLSSIAISLVAPGALPSQNFYSLLTAFSIFLQTKTCSRGCLLAKATAVGYMSQVVNLLRERYPTHLSDNKRIAKNREKMAAAIDERNLFAGVQTGEAPDCTLDDLCALVQETAIKGVGGGFNSLHDSAVLTLMCYTFGRTIDTCFARKNQLSIAASGELFLHVARIKTFVVQGISIYKSAKKWEQCMSHASGMLFVGAFESSSYVLPLVPHATTSDLPGQKTYTQEEAILYWEDLEEKAEAQLEPHVKRVRGRPSVAKYINDVIVEATKRITEKAAPLPPPITPGLSSHALRRGSAAYANASATGDPMDFNARCVAAGFAHEGVRVCWYYHSRRSKRCQSFGRIPRPASAV